LGATLTPFLTRVGYDVVRHSKTAESDVSCDLTDRHETLALLGRIRPDIVVNLVAQTDVDKCEEDPHEAYLLNVRVVENLVAGMRDRGNMHLIHLSTDQVYDSAGPSREDGIRLTNTYALTKYAGELAAAQMRSTVLRTNFFGPSLLLGRKSFSDWLLCSLQDREPITVFTDVVFNPLSMGTLCSMIDRVVGKRVQGVFNLGSRGFISKADFALELARTYGLAVDKVTRGLCSDMGLAAYRPKDMSMDCARFETAFDVELPGIQNEIRDLRRNPNAIT